MANGPNIFQMLLVFLMIYFSPHIFTSMVQGNVSVSMLRVLVKEFCMITVVMSFK